MLGRYFASRVSGSRIGRMVMSPKSEYLWSCLSEPFSTASGSPITRNTSLSGCRYFFATASTSSGVTFSMFRMYFCQYCC